MYHVNEIFGVAINVICYRSGFPSSGKRVVGTSVSDIIASHTVFPHLKDPGGSMVCPSVRSLDLTNMSLRLLVRRKKNTFQLLKWPSLRVLNSLLFV